MNPAGRLWALLILAALGAARLWVWLAVVAAGAAAAEVFLLWLHPYGKCRDLFHRGRGVNIGSSDEAYGVCPRCHGRNVPRRGAAAAANLIGAKYGRRYW